MLIGFYLSSLKVENYYNRNAYNLS